MRRSVALVAAVLTVTVGIGAGLVASESNRSSDVGRPTSPAPKVAVAIELERTTLRPGPIDRGVVIITNHSGRTLLIHDCRNRGGLVAGLTSSRVAYLVGPPLHGCHVARSIGQGVTSLATWIATTYQNCSTMGTPRCTGLGVSDLPPGTYRVRFPLAGLPPTTLVSSPTVTVLAPAWLASLHGQQGSLLVSASPCIGGLITSGTTIPGVTVVVIQRGNVIARRASASGSSLFTLALAPGRYVVRADTHMRTVVTISTRRQTIADLNPLCG